MECGHVSVCDSKLCKQIEKSTFGQHGRSFRRRNIPLYRKNLVDFQ